jgi:hypothetical protein
MAADFNFTDFTSNYPTSTLPPFSDALGSLQPLQTSPTVYAAAPPQQQNAYGQPGPRAERRNSEGLSSPRGSMNFEEATRLAAEEDKRRRNTAASARFRIKKKQREQALEKTAKEMGEKVTALEGRIAQLETENKWLKNLITEKNEGADVATLLKESASKQGGDSRKEKTIEVETSKESK